MAGKEEKLKLLASQSLHTLFSSQVVETPITSFDLLARVIAAGAPPSILPSNEKAPTFRLTQLPLFDKILKSLVDSWEFGKITLSNEGEGELIVADVRLGESSTTRKSPAPSHGKKRKRVLDEDADSAAGNVEEEEEDPRLKGPAPSTLDSLSNEMREVYSLLQRGTAKGRLLAEQVSTLLLFLFVTHVYISFSSSRLSTAALNLFVPTSRRRIAPGSAP